MYNQYGGLILKNKDKTGFQPICDMLYSDCSELKLLSYESQKSFVIILNVLPQFAEYFELSDHNNIIEGEESVTGVTSYILKIEVINQIKDLQLPYYHHGEVDIQAELNSVTSNKLTETKESLFQETKIQNYIWKQSIVGDRGELCPPIANLSIFEISDSVKILEVFINKAKEQYDNDLIKVFSYLNSVIINVNGSKIGIITMKNIKNSMSYVYLNVKTRNNIYIEQDDVDNLIRDIFAKIVRLYLDIGVINLDLHKGNILIYRNNNNNVESLLIDFGSVIIIDKNVDENYKIHYAKFFEILNKKNIYKNISKKRKNTIEDKEVEENNEKILFMVNIIQTIRNYSYILNWFYSDDSLLLLDSFNMLEKMMHINNSGITMETITQYEKSNYLPNFEDKSVENFIVNNPCPLRTKKRNPYCVISGGSRIRKRSKRKVSKRIKTKRIRK